MKDPEFFKTWEFGDKHEERLTEIQASLEAKIEQLNDYVDGFRDEIATLSGFVASDILKTVQEEMAVDFSIGKDGLPIIKVWAMWHDEDGKQFPLLDVVTSEPEDDDPDDLAGHVAEKAAIIASLEKLIAKLRG